MGCGVRHAYGRGYVSPVRYSAHHVRDAHLYSGWLGYGCKDVSRIHG